MVLNQMIPDVPFPYGLAAGFSLRLNFDDGFGQGLAIPRRLGTAPAATAFGSRFLFRAISSTLPLGILKMS